MLTCSPRRWLMAAALVLLAGCAQEPAPSKQDIQSALADKLPAYAQIADLELEAAQNLGTRVEPDWQARFNAGIRFPADTFTADGNDAGVVFVRQTHRAGEVIRIFGKSKSVLFAGKWKSELHFDGDPLSALGMPLSAFSGHKVIVRGTKEESDYHAEVAANAREQKLEEQRAAAEQHRLARQTEQQRVEEQRADEERRRRDDEATQQRLQAQFDADQKRPPAAGPAASPPPAPRVPADLARPNAVWMAQDGATLTILQRQGEWFQGRYQRNSGGGTLQDITGTVKDNQVFWTGDHVYTYRGERSGDCYGTFDGDKIYFNVYNADATYHVTFYYLHAGNSPLANTPAASAAPSTVPTAPVAPPFPSANLRAFVNAHIDRVLAPLGDGGVDQPSVLTDYRDALADDAGKALAIRRPAYQAAILVCNTLVNALAQRQEALNNLQGISSSKNSGSLGVLSASGYLSARQLHSEHRANQQVADGENSFVNSQRTAWLQRAAQLRQSIQDLVARERDTERQIAADEQARLVETSRLEAVRRYPEIAVNGSKLNRAFVARYGYYQREQPAYFQDAVWPLRLAEEVSQNPPSR